MHAFDLVYNNLQLELPYRREYRGVSSDSTHKWSKLQAMSHITLGLELGQAAKMKDDLGRKAIILATALGLVVVYEHIAGRSLLGTTSDPVLRDLISVRNGTSEDHVVMMFGRHLGKDNSHRLNDLIMELSRKVLDVCSVDTLGRVSVDKKRLNAQSNLELAPVGFGSYN